MGVARETALAEKDGNNKTLSVTGWMARIEAASRNPLPRKGRRKNFLLRAAGEKAGGARGRRTGNNFLMHSNKL